MTRAERREMWRERIAMFRASGQSVAEWSKAQGVKEHQVRYWLRRLAPVDAPPPATTLQWLPVSVWDGEPAEGDRGLVVRVGQAAIEVRPGFDPVLLVKVVRALSASC